MQNSKRQICRAIFEEICVLANGEVVCSCCDPAGLKVYGNIREQSIEEIFRGRAYRAMRRYQLKSNPGEYCPVLKDNCSNRITAATRLHTEAGLKIKYLQLEPISYCNLDCPECPVHHFETDQRYRNNRKTMLSVEEMVDVVRQLPELELILFFNYGEPFLHAGAIDFLRKVRQVNPRVFIDTSTNGIPLTDKKIDAIAGEKLLNHVLFSIDGAGQDSYVRYRRNGSFAKAFDNMVNLQQAITRYGNQNAIKLTWQYILFEWNDSDEELCHAKELAAENELQIKWVLTHTTGKSRRFSYDSSIYRELVGDKVSYDNLTRELRGQDLLENAVQGGKYACDIQCGRKYISDECIDLVITITNTSNDKWEPNDEDAFKVALMFLDEDGGLLYRVDGWDLDQQVAPGQSIMKHMYFRSPFATKARYVMIDLADHQSRLFKDRGSSPLLMEA